MRLNLLPIRSLVESLTMNDACLITRDPEGTSDDNWDEETGTYTPPENDRDEIYDGRCTVYPFSGVVQEEDQGGQQMAVSNYWLGIPMGAEVEVHPDDLVEITAVDPEQGDPILLDKVFVIESQEFLTMASSRRFRMKLLKEVP